jgi:hypothetical protein
MSSDPPHPPKKGGLIQTSLEKMGDKTYYENKYSQGSWSLEKKL